MWTVIITDTSKTNEPVSVIEILKELLDFMGYSGQFMKRRFKKFTKKMESQNIFHSDDFSAGIIYCGT